VRLHSVNIRRRFGFSFPPEVAPASNVQLIKENRLRRIIIAATLAMTDIVPSAVHAQEGVVVSDNPEALFTSPDPKLNANKQVVYRIILELLEAGQWDKASQYIADDYIQHNPNAQSGLKPLVYNFT
jgi:hypothetical protein